MKLYILIDKLLSLKNPDAEVLVQYYESDCCGGYESYPTPKIKIGKVDEHGEILLEGLSLEK